MKQIPSNFGSDWQNPRLLEGGGPAIELGPHPVRPANAAAPAVARTSYWRLAWDHKLLLIGFLLLGGIAGTAYVTFKRPLYRATATVEVVGFNQSFMGMNQVDPQAGTDITTASVSNIQTQSRILTSRNLVSRVVERMSLEMTPLNTTPSTFFTRLRSRLPFGNAEPLAQIRTDVATAAMSVTARGVIATRLIELQCESPSPEVSANFVNTLIAEH
ncbi:MAG TPA: Wzz/FepE/Etk N-terminal domain-containing protein, partial [Candidatus Solibacter sp.]|nr:Wzz/FepE/Etk N-terminal domain-containing protein [Candidatus Solibacter sp.]